MSSWGWERRWSCDDVAGRLGRRLTTRDDTTHISRMAEINRTTIKVQSNFHQMGSIGDLKLYFVVKFGGSSSDVSNALSAIFCRLEIEKVLEVDLGEWNELSLFISSVKIKHCEDSLQEKWNELSPHENTQKINHCEDSKFQAINALTPHNFYMEINDSP